MRPVRAAAIALTGWLLMLASAGCTAMPPVACNTVAECPLPQLCVANVCADPNDASPGDTGLLIDGGVE